MTKDLPSLFEGFIYECEFVRKTRPDTIQGYIRAFKTFTKLLPDISVEHLTATSIIQFFKILQERKRVTGKGMIKTGIKASTIASYWTKLNVFFEWLIVKAHLSVNPFSTLKRPTPRYEDKKFLHKAEVEKILSAIYLHHNGNGLLLKRNLVLFHLFLFCGLRKEEAMLLQVRDIDFNHKIITVRGETSKSGKTRQLPLHSSTLMHLKDYLNNRKKYTTPFVIVSNSRDEKLTYDGLKHLVQKIRRASGVSFHLHQLRHTFAVNFLRTSKNIFNLKTLLGHADIRMTTAYLRCLPPDEPRSEVEALTIDNFL